MPVASNPTLLCRCGRAGYPVAVPALRGPEMFGRSIGLRRGVDRPRTPPKPIFGLRKCSNLGVTRG